MKLSKIAFAVASTLVIASGAAFAGQIGSASVTIATEVIYADTQIVRAPSNNYAFSGNIDARTNQQLLQLQYTLSKGIFGSTVFPAINTLVPINVSTTAGPPAGPGLTAMLRVQYNDGSNTAQSVFPAGSTVNAFVTGDRKTLVFNVTIPANAGATNLLVTPNFTINSSNGAGENSGVSGLFTVAGVAACPAVDANSDISFKHFTTHNGNVDVINNGGPDSEHIRVPSTNSARLLNFTQNHTLTFTAASTNSRQDPATGNTKLSGSNVPAAVGVGAAGSAVAFTPLTSAALAGGRHYLGKLQANQRARAVDTDLASIYGDAVTADGFFLGSADTSLTAGNLQNGSVEYGDASIIITLPSGVPVGTTVSLASANGTALTGALVPQIATAGQTVFTFKAVTQGDIAAVTQQPDPTGPATHPTPSAGTGFAGGVYAYIDFPGGTNVIPQLSSIATVGQLNKNVAGPNREQSISCPGNLAGIGGGIKIDVRNYASKAKFPSGNYASYVRLINNSEFNTADVFAQMIYADGTYGPYGALPSLAPRAVANYSNAALEALMITTPAANNPFGATTAYTQTAGTTVNGTLSGGSTAALGDRVRFVSNTGTTLRIQSYILLPNGNLLDTTSAQGVDFENTTNNRVPATAVDAQPVSQDAINGLAR